MTSWAGIGWVLQEPVRRTSASTHREVVTWRGGVKDSSGQEHQLNFEVTDPQMMETAERDLQPGRAYEGTGELVTRPYSKRGVIVAQIEIVTLHTLRLGKPVGQKTEAAPAAVHA
jgi:hypothetical protein